METDSNIYAEMADVYFIGAIPRRVKTLLELFDLGYSFADFDVKAMEVFRNAADTDPVWGNFYKYSPTALSTFRRCAVQLLSMPSYLTKKVRLVP